MARRRHNQSGGLEAWPGYVDALSTLLMVTIFVLLVFVLAQGFLSAALTGSNKQLDKLNAQVAQISNALSLERAHAGQLQLSVSQLSKQLDSANTARDTLARQLQAAKQRVQQALAESDTLRAERTRLTEQLSDTNQVVQSQSAANQKLQTQLVRGDHSGGYREPAERQGHRAACRRPGSAEGDQTAAGRHAEEDGGAGQDRQRR